MANHLRFFSVILLISLLPVGFSSNSPRSEVISFENWHCGANDFDKSLSHQMSKEECPKRMYEADLCCVVHDICYMEDERNQKQCDEAFCHCLDRTVAQVGSRNSNQTTAAGCGRVSDSYCEIVKIFGSFAYASSRKLADKQKAALAAWEKAAMTTTTTKAPVKASKMSDQQTNQQKDGVRPKDSPSPTPTTPTSSTSSPSIKTTISASHLSSTTPSPATIGRFVTHKFPLDCYDETLSVCTTQLHQCTSKHFQSATEEKNNENSGNALLLGVQLAECSTQFCACSRAKIVRETQRNPKARYMTGKGEGDECWDSLAAICTQFGVSEQKAAGPIGHANVHFWSVNINYIGQSVSSLLVMVCSLLIVLAICFACFLLFKGFLILKRRFLLSMSDSSLHKNYTKGSIRRNTLTALRSVSGAANDLERGGPHYMPFGHQKESTVSSPASTPAEEQANEKLLGNGHGHHKKAHSDVVPNRNLLQSIPHGQHLPMNSSQIQLISENNGNSSSTLSDLSSS